MNVKAMTNVIVDLQIAYSAEENLPCDLDFQRWIGIVLTHVGYKKTEAEITIRIVDNAEIQTLNRDYRGKDKSTNVLSFPFDEDGLPDEVVSENTFLGDIIIAPDVLAIEAGEQGKVLQHHWAHMTIHGVLHLLGFDHETDVEAVEMEAQEVSLLHGLHIKNPYKL